VQDHNGGWLTRELMDQVAAYLDMPEVAVYEVASFYAMYDLEPVGRHKICVCNSVSCMLGGAEDLMEHIEKKYGVKPGRTTATASSRSRSSSASAPAAMRRR
jgi:NADH-quinone oxidoreductase subunit E